MAEAGVRRPVTLQMARVPNAGEFRKTLRQALQGYLAHKKQHPACRTLPRSARKRAGEWLRGAAWYLRLIDLCITQL